MFKTKILVLGPCGSGKSTIANFLADAAEVSGDAYRPTQGVRIVEFESNGLELSGSNIDAEVELWDCSGDKKPAIQKDANGVILVCNPDKPDQHSELENWHSDFVTRRGLSAKHVVVLQHLKPECSSNPDATRLPTSLSGIQRIVTDIQNNGESLRLEFNNFLCNVIEGLRQKMNANNAD